MDTEEEYRSRVAYTSGWYKESSMKESLPIKTSDGRVIRTVRPVTHDDESQLIQKSVNSNNITNLGYDDGGKGKIKSSHVQSNSIPDVHSITDINKIKVMIGNICTEVIADPQYGVKKKHDFNEKGEPRPKLTDLFQFLQHPMLQVRELATLSCFLIFKDICPGYKIRTKQEFDNSVQLKKETKQLRDFELALLAMYLLFLKYLDDTIVATLGKSLVIPTQRNSISTKLGLSAIRIQCELIRCLLHFNYRSMLLNSIITYGAQKDSTITNLCCSTLQHILTNDQEGEASYEIVKIISTVMISRNYNISDTFLDVLKYIKLGVHADDAKDVRKVAKRERRKRRRQDDDVETGLLEADVVSSKSISRRFQADCLHETSLIYFRIIKMKSSFKLLPTALEGLSRISHLINIDTVEDLLIILKNILTSASPAPLSVRILCIHCGLKTLSGPGKELEADDDVYINGLRNVLEEVTSNFSRWDLLLECVEICVIKYREMKNSLVMSFVKRLFLLSPHLVPSIATVALALAHSILLRYPRARSSMMMFSKGIGLEEDAVADFAMKSLREETSSDDTGDGDGSWILPLLLHHADKRLKPVILSLSSKDILPIPLRLHEAKLDIRTVDGILDSSFKSLPESIQQDKTQFQRVKHNSSSENMKMKQNATKKQKRQDKHKKNE